VGAMLYRGLRTGNSTCSWIQPISD
jgi:hypothetical protein